MIGSITLDQALKILLGGRESLFARAAERITTIGILTTPLWAGPAGVAAWATLDVKSEAFGQFRDMRQLIREHISKKQGYDKSSRLHAAHGILVFAAFFDACDDVLKDMHSLDYNKLTHDDREAVFRTRSSMLDGTRSHLDLRVAFSEMTLPAIDMSTSHSQRKRELAALYEDIARFFTGYVRGLSVWDEMSDTQRDKFLQGHIKREIISDALRKYESGFQQLAEESREFMVWALLQETWSADDAMLGLSERLSQDIARLSALITTQSESLAALSQLMPRRSVEPSPEYAWTSILDRRYVAQLQKALLGERWASLDAESIAVPTVEAGYVNPALTYLPVDMLSDAKVNSESWWRKHSRPADIQAFLAGWLSSPQGASSPLLLMGHPGAGKSLLTWVLAGRLVGSDWMPLRVPLRSVVADADVTGQVEEAIRLVCGEPVTWAQIRRARGHRRILILLDGFDELLQATGASRSEYLQRVAAAQQNELDVDNPMAVIVTSRTVMADRAVVPQGCMVARIEPFTKPQIRQWIERWNRLNAASLKRRGLKPLTIAALEPYQDLAGQPLLLMLLSILDATANGLQSSREPMSTTQLYEALIHSFMRREASRFDAGQLSDALVEAYIERLAVVALGMYNRSAQVVAEDSVNADLKQLNMSSTASEKVGAPEVRVSLSPAERVLGQFFFVVESQALGPRSTAVRTYEFLHATFGEFLVARTLVRHLQRSAELRRATQPFYSEARRIPELDTMLLACLTSRVLATAPQIVEYVQSLLTDLSAQRFLNLKELSEFVRLSSCECMDYHDLISGAAYRPVELPAHVRTATLGANLAILVACSGQGREAAAFGCEVDRSHVERWRSIASFWRGQLNEDVWRQLIDRLMVRSESGQGDGEVPLRLSWNGASKKSSGFEYLRRDAEFTQNDAYIAGMGAVHAMIQGTPALMACVVDYRRDIALRVLELRATPRGADDSAVVRLYHLVLTDLAALNAERGWEPVEGLVHIVLTELRRDAAIIARKNTVELLRLVWSMRPVSNEGGDYYMLMLLASAALGASGTDEEVARYMLDSALTLDMGRLESQSPEVVVRVLLGLDHAGGRGLLSEVFEAGVDDVLHRLDFREVASRDPGTAVDAIRWAAEHEFNGWLSDFGSVVVDALSIGLVWSLSPRIIALLLKGAVDSKDLVAATAVERFLAQTAQQRPEIWERIVEVDVGLDRMRGRAAVARQHLT